MFRRGGIRFGGVLALLLLLGAPLAAEPRGGSGAGLDLGSFWSRVVQWIEVSLNPWSAQKEAACELGPGIDPNGCPHSPSTTPNRRPIEISPRIR
jgi:hypothetical protein